MCGSKRKQELALLVSVEKALSWRRKEVTVKGDLRRDFTHRQTDTRTTATQNNHHMPLGLCPMRQKFTKTVANLHFLNGC